MSIEIDVRGLDELTQRLARMERGADSAASQSVNRAASFGRALTSREIRSEVNFSAGYLNEDNRLHVSKTATRDNPEATITARDRPTSLRRFATTKPTVGKGPRRGIRVKVSANGTGRTIKGAFFMRLRKGTAAVTEENSNIGLAVRLKPGEEGRLDKRQMAPVGKSGLYLLYGPSVGQVARDVFESAAGPIGDKLAEEFTRNFGRMTGG